MTATDPAPAPGDVTVQCDLRILIDVDAWLAQRTGDTAPPWTNPPPPYDASATSRTPC